MSASVAWELAPTPGRMPLRSARPQLRLVLPGERVMAPVGVATRINRRGRLLVTLTVLAATTVSAGQTLSEVAAAQLPGLPINEGVARIQLANGLNTSQVHAGQSLLIPSLP